MLSFDQLVADRDALKAKGCDTKVLDAVVADHKIKTDEALKQFLERETSEQLEYEANRRRLKSE